MQATLTRPMTTPTYPGVTVVPANEGTTLNAFGDSLLMKLDGDRTNNALEIFVGTTPPQAGPPPHVHHNEDEIFLIIEGRIRFFSDGRWTEPCGPGTLAYAPRGSRHTFQNAGETPSRHWVITTGGGFGQFFAQCAGVFDQPAPPDMARILAISAAHGIEYVPPLGDAPPEAA